MSSTSTFNENYIDNKKNKNDNKNENTDWKIFFKSLLNFIIFIFFIILFGSIGLYLSKIVKSNILPTDLKLKPFGSEFLKILNKEVDINIIKIREGYGFNLFKEPIIKSEKAIFQGDKYINSFDNNNNILGYLNKNILKNNLFLYYQKVFANIISINNIILNKIFSIINSDYIPEWLVIFIFGIFIIPFLFFSYIFNYIISIIYHLTNIKQLLRNKVSDDPINYEKLDWEKEYKISFFRINKLPNIIITFFISLFTSFIIPIIPILMTFYSIISPLFIEYKSSLDNFKTNKYFSNFLSSTFSSQRIFILFLLSYKLLSLSYSDLGTNYFIGFLIGILVIIFYFKSFQNI